MAKMKMIAIVFLTALLLSACGSGGGVAASGNGNSNSGQPSSQTPAAKQPVTLKVNFTGALQDVFQTYVEPALQKKYPYITLQYVTGKWEDMIAAGDVPDIIMPNGTLFNVMDLNLQTDLHELVKKHNYDLSRIDQGLIKSIMQYSPKGELYALPASKGAQVLLYNKDIFDKFGVPYPKGHMQWDEVYELAKKLTRTADGIQYKGFNPDGIGTFSNQLQLSYFDANDKATFTKDEGWKKAVDMWLKFRTLPGNEPKKGGRDSFTKDKDTAMIVTQVSFLLRDPVPGLNYDMVESPTFENNLRANGLGTMFVITSTSKHQDDAFEVIKLYHSDEVQTAIERDAGLFTELNNPEIQKQFGANKPELNNLNLQANFKGDQAVKVVNRYEGEGSKAITNALNSVVKGEMDVNTALRKAEEALNARMAELVGSNK